MTPFTSDGTENKMRWDRRTKAFMEVWYSTITHRASGAGVWFRYTLTAPEARVGPPYCELWAFYFDPDGKRSFAGKHRFEIDELAASNGRDDGALVRIGDSWLSENHLEGEVAAADRRLRWSIDFEPSLRCYQHLPAVLRSRLERRASVVCSPNLSVPMTGEVELDGEVLSLYEDPGAQSHRWGRRHPESWAWAHCSMWDEGATAVFEGVAAKPSLGPVSGPTTTFLYLEHAGQEIAFNELKWALRSRSRYELPTWAFSARNEDWKLAGAARIRTDRSFQVTYEDPDGSKRYCANSETGDLAIELYTKTRSGWRHEASLTSIGTAHVEFGRRERFEELSIAL